MCIWVSPLPILTCCPSPIFSACLPIFSSPPPILDPYPYSFSAFVDLLPQLKTKADAAEFGSNKEEPYCRDTSVPVLGDVGTTGDAVCDLALTK